MAKKNNIKMPDELKPVVNAKPHAAAAPKPTAPKRPMRRSGSPKAKAAPRRKSIWRKIAGILLWILTAVSSCALILGCFGGNLRPTEYRGMCLLVMMLPGWLILMGISTVLNILWCRKALPLSLLVWIACAAGVWEFMPLNLTRPSLDKAASYPQFTFLTYNITNFTDLTDRYPGDINPTVSNILKINADVVNLQEAVVLTPTPKIHLTQAQIDSLHRAYPYILMYGKSQMLMSKYPAKAIHIGEYNTRNEGSDDKGGEIAVFRLNIEGESVTLFDVHLKSFSLTPEDKELFKDVTDLKDTDGNIKGTMIDVKSQLLSKVQHAAEVRQRDADRLGRLIEKYGGPNVIVAGDFNDVPGCYTLRHLADFKLHQVYSELGFGPMITFNRDRFYFRIDHVLYRGALKPLRMQRGSSLASDHYPLLVRFAITDEKSDN